MPSDTVAIGLASESEWRSFLRTELDGRADIFFFPEYHRAWAAHEGAESNCLAGRADGFAFIYPFLKKRHPPELNPEPHSDIFSPYGYGGILSNCPAPPNDVAERMNRAIDEWCAANGIVAELIRESPYDRWSTPGLRRLSRTKVRRNVYYLSSPSDKTVRLNGNALRSVRKAGKRLASRKVDYCQYLAAFKTMYTATMQRLHASNFYFFDRNYFQSLYECLGDRVSMHMVCLDETPVAGAICLRSKDAYTSLLVASSWDYRGLHAMDLLYYSVLEHALGSGVSVVSWGGGTTPSPADGLYRFKEKYGNFVADCCIGTKVHNAAAYARVTRRWAEKYPSLVPAYGKWLLRHHQAK